MDFDQFIAGVDIRKVSLKEAVGMYAMAKIEAGGDGNVTVVEVLNVQTAYIDKLRMELLKEA